MKQSYIKPLINRVELVMDQAVLLACKTVFLATGPLGGGGDCEVGSGTQCFDLGS